MKIPFFQVDAFTDKPFHGNPAAVVILSLPRETRWMQDVAKEMNLSETAFLWPLKEGYSLRWFTPAVEVELCGHATLASAHFLWEARYLKPQTPARFFTRSGLLTFSNPHVDDLLLKGREIIDFKLRKSIYSEIQEILWNELPILPLFVPYCLMGVSKRIEITEKPEIIGSTNSFSSFVWKVRFKNP